MKIFTDKLTLSNLYGAVPQGLYLDAEYMNTKKRDHGFEVHMVADEGDDAHGIKRRYHTNSGRHGAGRLKRAPTWVEWGDWMVQMFIRDYRAIIGNYDGYLHFIATTKAVAASRPKHEEATIHAERWEQELISSEPWTV